MNATYLSHPLTSVSIMTSLQFLLDTNALSISRVPTQKTSPLSHMQTANFQPLATIKIHRCVSYAQQVQMFIY